MLSRSASSGKPDSNSLDCIVAWYFCGVVVSVWLGYLLLRMLFGDAVVSAWLGYSLSQMLFPCQSCIIASAIYLFHDLQILISEKRYPQFTYSKTCRCQPPQNCICNLLISNLADTSNTSSFTQLKFHDMVLLHLQGISFLWIF